MPKLSENQVVRRKHKIEEAALRVFIRQGYHGTSMREIADASRVSIGNIYNYYPTKEDLFVAIVQRYERKMDVMRAAAVADLDGVFDEEGLSRLAANIRKIVYDNPDYWRLMYIDVVEFGNRHFAHSFRNLAANMEHLLGDRLRAASSRGPWRGVKPALAFTAIYLQFFTYFLVEKLFGGKQHLGVPDQEAVAEMIQMVTHGIWRDEPRLNAAAQGGSQ